MKRIVVSLLMALCISSVQMDDSEGTLLSLMWMPSTATMAQLIQESDCFENGDLTIEEVKEYIVHDKVELAESKPELKCLTACFLDYIGIMDNCKIIYVANLASLKHINDSLQRCKEAEEAGDRCLCAYKLMKCLIEDAHSREADN